MLMMMIINWWCVCALSTLAELLMMMMMMMVCCTGLLRCTSLARPSEWMSEWVITLMSAHQPLSLSLSLSLCMSVCLCLRCHLAIPVLVTYISKIYCWLLTGRCNNPRSIATTTGLTLHVTKMVHWCFLMQLSVTWESSASTHITVYVAYWVYFSTCTALLWLRRCMQ